MSSRPYLSKYFIPCTDSIDSVLDRISSVPELEKAAIRLKEHFAKHNFESLPPVTEEDVRKTLLPHEAEYVLNTSYHLTFRRNNMATTIFISRELEMYIAIEKRAKKSKVKIIGATSRTLGYDILRKYLITSKLVSKDVPRFTSRYYEPLDFRKLYDDLQEYLPSGVTLEISYLLPSRLELDKSNLTYESLKDKNENCLEIVEYPEATFLALWIVCTDADVIHEAVISVGFEQLEFAFSEPNEVWTEFLDTYFWD